MAEFNASQLKKLLRVPKNPKTSVCRYAGLDHNELAVVHAQAVDKNSPPEEFVRLFGTDINYEFTGLGSAGFIPTYNNLRRPLFVDNLRRLYYVYEKQDPCRLIVKIPKHQTHLRNIRAIDDNEVLPEINQTITLYSIYCEERTITITDIYVPETRLSIALITFSLSQVSL
jgi:hypothetical protein